jgi:hypothetical protein
VRKFRDPIVLPECRPQTTTSPFEPTSLVSALKILLAEEAGRRAGDAEVGGPTEKTASDWGWGPPSVPPAEPEPEPEPSDQPSEPSPSPEPSPEPDQGGEQPSEEAQAE